MNAAAGQPNSNSPTGRQPFFIWTEAWQSRNRALFQAGDAVWMAVKGDADLIGTSGERYFDLGIGAMALAYVADPADRAGYAAKAVTKLLKDIGNSATLNMGADYLREYMAWACIRYDWLYTFLTSAQKTACMASLMKYADWCLNRAAGFTHYARMSDSDQSLGEYGCLALLHHLAVPENAYAYNLLNQTCNGTGINAVSVGGLDPTAADTSSYRNTIYKYCVDYAVGGDWFESSEYNHGTKRSLARIYASLQTCLQDDHMPEVAALAESLGLYYYYAAMPSTPANTGRINDWGDVQSADDYHGHAWDWMATVGCWQGVAAAQASTYAGELTKLLKFTITTFPYSDYNGLGGGQTVPLCQMAMMSDPTYTPAADYSALPVRNVSTGSGQITTIHSDSPSVRSFLMLPRQNFCDHNPQNMASFSLMRKNEWPFFSQQHYAGNYRYSVYYNCIGAGGLGAMQASYDNLRVDTGTVGGKPYTIGVWQTHGLRSPGGYKNPPPNFCQSWEVQIAVVETGGSIVFVYRTKGTATTVVSGDYAKFNVQHDATTLSNVLTRTGGVIREGNMHSSVAPTDVSGGWKWTTAAGNHCKVDLVSPAMSFQHFDDVADAANLGSNDSGLAGGQTFKQTRFWPNAQVDTQSMIFAAQARDDDSFVSISYTDDDHIVVNGLTVHFDATTSTIT